MRWLVMMAIAVALLAALVLSIWVSESQAALSATVGDAVWRTPGAPAPGAPAPGAPAPGAPAPGAPAPGAPGRLVLVGVLLVLAVLPAAALAQAPVREPFCYTWEFLNNTGEDADGLVVILAGVQQVTSVYQGSDNPFGAPLPTSGYDAGLDAYMLEFGEGTALDGMSTHIGACTDRDTLHLSPVAPAFFWTAAGAPIEPAPLFLGLAWTRLPGGALHVTVNNQHPFPLVITSLSLLQAAEALPIDDLNADTVATLPALAELIDEVLILPTAGSESFDIAAETLAGLPASGSLVLSAEFATEADLFDSGRLYAQLLAPQRTHLPLINR